MAASSPDPENRQFRPTLLPSGDVMPTVTHVSQPYGGTGPQQMEGLIANYYEYHFLDLTGKHHFESRNVQGVSLMNFHFHPGSKTGQASAEPVG